MGHYTKGKGFSSRLGLVQLRLLGPWAWGTSQWLLLDNGLEDATRGIAGRSGLEKR